MKFIVATICYFLIVTYVEGNPGRRILGAENASEGQFPFQVSLQLFGNHFCGGSILNSKTILTACHCFYNEFKAIMEWKASATTVLVGSIDKNKGTTHKVKILKCHKQYNRKGHINDIALLKVEPEIRFSSNVKSIKLPTSNIADNKKLNVSGWGMTYYEGTLKDPQNVKDPDNLQFLEFRKINLEECMERMRVTEGMLCASPRNPFHEGVCKGDSGGPLATKDGTQYGIVSWASGDCDSGKPQVFTNVFSYIDWIQRKMWVSPEYDYYD